MKGPTANPYQGQGVGDQAAQGLTGAFGLANTGAGYGQQALKGAGDAASAAGGAFGAGIGQMPQDVTADTLPGMDLTGYMNPFQQNVIDTTMGEMRRQEDIGLRGVDDAAMAGRAWGGDRQSIERAELRRNMDQQRANILAQLNTGNFNNAQQMATADANRRLAASQGNQQTRGNMWQTGAQGMGSLASGLAGFGADMMDPQKLAQLSQQGFNFYNTIAQNNLQAGTLQQQQIQAAIDAARQQWEQFANKPLQGLGAITGATNVPSGYGKTEQKPGMLGILGGGVSALGTLAGICDRSVKCDIEEIGVHEGTGLKLYAFRYKNDPKTYPKVVGPMADEVEELYPDMVRTIGGKKTIKQELMQRIYG